MRLFFSAEKKSKDTLNDLKHLEATYKNVAAQFAKLNQVIDGYKALVGSDMDALYWELTADFGRSYINMCVAWSERCVKRLEEVSNK